MSNDCCRFSMRSHQNPAGKRIRLLHARASTMVPLLSLQLVFAWNLAVSPFWEHLFLVAFCFAAAAAAMSMSMTMSMTAIATVVGCLFPGQHSYDKL